MENYPNRPEHTRVMFPGRLRPNRAVPSDCQKIALRALSGRQESLDEAVLVRLDGERGGRIYVIALLKLSPSPQRSVF